MYGMCIACACTQVLDVHGQGLSRLDVEERLADQARDEELERSSASVPAMQACWPGAFSALELAPHGSGAAYLALPHRWGLHWRVCAPRLT